MNDLQIINEQEVLGKQFRIYGSVEEPLFLAKDVAEWIEHSNARMMLNAVDEDEKQCVNNPYALKGQQEQWFLTESGLYEVLMQSRKPIAKQLSKEIKRIMKEKFRHTLLQESSTNNLVSIIDNRVVVSSRQIAEHFGKEHDKVCRDIKTLISQSPKLAVETFYENDYVSPRGRTYKEYLMNRDGFALLVMGFTGKQALEWKIKYIEAFNAMEEELKNNSPRPMTHLEIVAESAKALVEHERKLKEIGTWQVAVDKNLDNIKEIMTLRPSSWRKDTNILINRMAMSSGTHKDVRAESYNLLNERYGVNIYTRLNNMRNRMKEAGACKSKINKTNLLDVIDSDKALIEGYITIIKELAIKYGIDITESEVA